MMEMSFFLLLHFRYLILMLALALIMLFPGKIDIAFNVRYSTETNADEIKQRIVNVIES